MRYVGWVQRAVLVTALGCGQSADVVGDRNDPPPPPPPDTGWQTDFEACATERIEASLVHTSLFLAVDSSCSMDDDAATGTTKWEAASSAFTGFFTDPSTSTLDLALKLWPSSDGCDANACDPEACADPLVPLGSLGDPTHQEALVDAFAGTSPSGNTPMHAALDGAVRWATVQRDASPDGQVAIVFVTDGEPNGCDENFDHIAGLAAAAADAGVPVFAVGIEGSNTDQIDQIAQAGSTGAGYFVGNANAEADLRAALEAIQDQVVSCQYVFPTESTSDPLSPNLVRVEYTDASGDTVLVGRVRDASACTDGGWYLDDPDDPSTITLCPSTCAEVEQIAEVTIEIDVGCECVTHSDCPDDHVCTDDGCVPRCVGPDCYDTAVPPDAVRGAVAVQGGALNCASSGGALAPAGLVLALAGLLAVRGRRTPEEAS